MEILKGHISPETAHLVNDYPYGFRLRCKIRYWLEYHPKHGFRLVSQTSNPKRGDVWNKPKASTYAKFGGCMFLDDAGHVQWSGLTEYCSGAEAKAWADTYGEGVPEAGRDIMKRWVAAKVAYDANRNSGDPLTVGLPQARKAFSEAGEASVTRYVPTYVKADGMRTLMRGAQGRDTFATEAEAQSWIDAVTKNNSADSIRQAWGENPRFEVRPCPCWPGHFDPKTVWFGE